MTIQRTKTIVTMIISTLLAIVLVACTPPSEPEEGAGQPITEPTIEPTVEPTEPQVDTIENQLIGTNWELISMGGMEVDGGMTLDFSADNAAGSDGCNSFGGGYTIADGQLVFDNFAVTEMFCMDEGVMEMAQQYLTALMTASDFTLDNDSLIVQTESGELVYTQAVNAELNDTTWQLNGLNNGSGGIVHTAIDEDIFMTITDEGIGGNGGCNGFGGDVTIEGNQITVGPIISTQMFCEGISERESEFFAALENAASYEITRQTLHLYDGEGNLLASFVAADENMDEEMTESEPITDINWSLVHTIVGGDAVVPVANHINPNFTITDGMISGTTGCNRINGTVTIDGNNISFGPLATTRMACEEERMSLETALLDIFAQTAIFTRNGDQLELQNADGLPLATFTVADVKTLYIGAETAECVGVGPQQCLLVKEYPNAEYTFFYDSIGGFEWEAGYEYELLVSVTERQDVPMDASTLQYKLVEIVSKEAVAMEDSDLLGTVWQWVAFESSADGFSFDIANPADYTIQFMDDGSYAIKADCNSGGGSYTQDGNSVTIQPGVMTLMACGEESRDAEFGRMLGDVVTFVFDDDGNLVMNLKVDAGNMVFVAAE